MTDASLVPLWAFSVINENSKRIVGAQLFTFEADTVDTVLATFKDEDLTPGNENPNPVLTDAAGRFPDPVYAQNRRYKFVLKDDEDNVLQTIPVWQPVSLLNPVGNYAALKALDVGLLTEGQIIPVDGRTAAGDRGEGDWRATEVNPGADDDGTILHSDTAGWFFERLIESGLRPPWFGADFTGVSDALAACQALNDVAYNRGGFDMQTLPDEQYLLSGQLDFYNTVGFDCIGGRPEIGDGSISQGDLTFKATAAASSVIWHKEDPAAGGTANRAPRVRNLTFDGDRTASRGVNFGVVPQSDVQNVYSRDCLIANIVLDGTQNSRFANLEVFGYPAAGDGVLLINNARNNYFQNMGSNKRGSDAAGGSHLVMKEDVASPGFAESQAAHGAATAEGGVKNTFVECLFESGDAECAIDIIEGSQNQFMQSNSLLPSGATGTCGLRLGSATFMNEFINHRLVVRSGMTACVIDNGFGNVYRRPLVANSGGVPWFQVHDKIVIEYPYNLNVADTNNLDDLYETTDLIDNQSGRPVGEVVNLKIFERAMDFADLLNFGTFSVTDTTFAFNNANPDTITDSGNGFVTAGFLAGMSVLVTQDIQGATVNVGTFLIDTVAAGTLTLDAAETLTTEAAGASITLTQINLNSPPVEIWVEDLKKTAVWDSSTSTWLLAENRTQHPTIHADISSGTEVEWLNIPDWVTKIEIFYVNHSAAASEDLVLQIGDSGGYETSGYVGRVRNATAGTDWGAHAVLTNAMAAAAAANGMVTMVKKPDEDLWLINGTSTVVGAELGVADGNKTLSGTLDRVKLFMDSGTTFDGTAADYWLYYE